MKRFKTKKQSKKNRKKRLKIIIFTFFFFFSYMFMVKYLKDNQLKNTILQEDVNYIDFNMKKEIVKKVDKIINNPIGLLNENVRNALNDKKANVNSEVKKVNKQKDEGLLVDVNNPLVYVYNTHQTEAYFDYSIYDAAKYLTDKLKEVGISTYFEEQSIKTFLDSNNLKYYMSYKASRKYLDEAKIKYPNIKYFFDIHRDSVSKKISTLTHDGKNYAKVLFVVGTDNPGSQNNKKNAEKLNEIIKSKVPNISRGIVYHGGKGYNGIYNQDVSENVFLIEVGGKDNTKEEVLNTVEVLKESILQYINGVI